MKKYKGQNLFLMNKPNYKIIERKGRLFVVKVTKKYERESI